ncbi:MAG: hypothetical protein JXB14_04510 [Candidatus Altiarchaeota archaeon]|nr:hypothetical protein [Candidatus Altiarchaeota archaeon]
MFGGKKETVAKPTTRQLRFEELEVWINGKKTSFETEIAEESGPILGEASRIIKGVEERNNDLASAKISKEVQQRIMAIVTSSRDNYVSGLKMALGRLKELNARSSGKEMTDMLLGLQQLDSRYGERVYFGFPDEMKKLRKEIKNLAEVSKRLEDVTKDKRVKAELLETALDKVHAIKDYLKSVEGTEVELERLKGDVSKSESEKKRLEGESESIMTSQRALDLKEREGILTGHVNRNKEIDSIILNMLAPLKRVLKKYKRLAETGKCPPGNVTSYIEDPVGTFLSGDNTLESLTLNVRRAISEDSLELTASEKDKMLRRIDEINIVKMENMRLEFNNNKRRMESLEGEMSRLDTSGELEELRRRAESIESSAKEAKTRAERLERERQDRKDDIGKTEAELAKTLSQFLGGRCEIIY